ncbi:MAG: hypothetical protein ABJK28_17495 [Algibacter sp.]
MNFKDTLLWLETYKKKSGFLITELNSKTDVYLELKENSDCFIFPVNVTSPFYKKIFNDTSRFLISDNEMRIEVNNYNLESGKDFLHKHFKAYIFQSEFFDKEDKYLYRLLCPIQSSFYILNLNSEHSDKLELKFDDANLNVFTSSSDNENYLVLESNNMLLYREFIHLANSTLFVLGFLSGNLIKGEELVFQTKDKSWKECNGFFRRKLKKSIKCYQPITSTPTQYSNFIKDKNYNYKQKISYLEQNKIGEFVGLVVKNSNFFLALKLLLEIWNNSFVNRPSTLYVVLEIIVDEIVKGKSKTFIEKLLVKEKSLEILNKYEAVFDTKDFNFLNDAIGEIDKKLTQNNKKYEEAFKILEIQLNIEDKKCLNKRNQFFHGRVVPKNILINNEDDYVNLELEYYSLTQRLFTLISKLILKKVNYSGYVINHPKMREEQSKKSFNEEYFVNI